MESAGFKNADLALTPGQVLENIHAVQRQQIPHSGLRPHAGYRIFSRSPPSSEADCGGVFGVVDSREGDCWDNACSESLFGSLKVERLHGQRFKTRLQAKDEVAAWLLWYNSIRLHSTLAYVSPMQFEKTWLAAQHRQANP